MFLGLLEKIAFVDFMPFVDFVFSAGGVRSEHVSG